MASSIFDERLKFVTSYLFPSWWLACIRLLYALYTLAVLVFVLVWEAKEDNGIINS